MTAQITTQNIWGTWLKTLKGDLDDRLRGLNILQQSYERRYINQFFSVEDDVGLPALSQEISDRKIDLTRFCFNQLDLLVEAPQEVFSEGFQLIHEALNSIGLADEDKQKLSEIYQSRVARTITQLAETLDRGGRGTRVALEQGLQDFVTEVREVKKLGVEISWEAFADSINDSVLGYLTLARNDIMTRLHGKQDESSARGLLEEAKTIVTNLMELGVKFDEKVTHYLSDLDSLVAEKLGSKK